MRRTGIDIIRELVAIGEDSKELTTDIEQRIWLIRLGRLVAEATEYLSVIDNAEVRHGN